MYKQIILQTWFLDLFLDYQELLGQCAGPICDLKTLNFPGENLIVSIFLSSSPKSGQPN